MKYQIKDGTVTLGGETILSHIDFEIQGNQKIAVVGRNGAGKTTLLRLMAGTGDRGFQAADCGNAGTAGICGRGTDCGRAGDAKLSGKRTF